MSRHERKRRRARSKGGPGRFIFLTLGVAFLVVAGGICGVVAWGISVYDDGPNLSELKPLSKGAVSTVYASDGKTKLGTIQYDVLRTPLPASQIPDVMRNATVAIEDKRFFQHSGVDYEGVARAAFKNVTTGKTAQGGSTLEMQLIRNLYQPDTSKTIERKIREAKLADQLEKKHPGVTGKDWILNKYLNVVPYGTVGGQEAIGVAGAARVFFDKKASQLTLPQAALLAGLPQAPSEYNPFTDKKIAKVRRNQVLKAMYKQHFISYADAIAAMKAPLGTKRNSYYKQRHEAYFFDYVKQQLINTYGAARVTRGGMKIYTTIDLKMQKLARHSIYNRLNQPGDPSAAIVSIDPHTGYIRAMASSGKYAESKFNLATQARRQPGSTFKVMVLMTALRQNIDINKTTYDSKPLDFFDAQTGTQIKVTTDDHSYSGRTTLFEGLVKSDNTVYQQLDLDMGPQNVRKTAYDMGITSHLDAYPAEGLGGLTHGVTPLEMTRAYTTINTGGWRIRPVSVKKVVFPGGKVDKRMAEQHRTKIFTDGQTAEARSAMEANVARGTGTAAQLSGCQAAGKTGTTSNFTDAWFDGFTPNLTTAVWVGYPKETTSMTDVPGYGTMFGGDAPAEIWHDFMQEAAVPTCGTWAPIKEPFSGHEYLGHYATSGAPGGGDDPEAKDDGQSTDGNGDSTDTTGDTTGAGGNDQYAAPPQGEPKVPDPPKTPSVPDTGNGGGGNGDGGGANDGGGTGTNR
jgi:penicillin-binding protein 1A